MHKLLSLGDCNTQGIGSSAYDAYPEKLAKRLKASLLNGGNTMSTTREGVRFFQDNFTPDVKIITIQYGLVDSWKTFRYAPYVLYYPDSRWRKFARKVAKKFKKIGRSLKLKALLGEVGVVPLDEYASNICSIIEAAKTTPVILIETIPNQETHRNEAIRSYNKRLEDIAKRYPQVYVLKTYEAFEKNMDGYYLDQTRINHSGHEFLVKELESLIKDFQLL